MEKYIANNAAKNMSSLESHTMVPTLTMLGRVSEWIRLLSMAGAAVTSSLWRLSGADDRGGGKPADFWAAGGLCPSAGIA